MVFFDDNNLKKLSTNFSRVKPNVLFTQLCEYNKYVAHLFFTYFFYYFF